MSKILRIKKLVLILILLCTGLFVVSQFPILTVEMERSAGNKKEGMQKYRLAGDQSFQQHFFGNGEELESIVLKLQAKEPKNNKGNVSVQLQTLDGEVLAEGKMKLSKAKKTESTYDLSFAMGIKLENEKEYILDIQINKAKTKDKCSFVGLTQKDELFGDLYIDGNPVPERLRMSFITRIPDKGRIRVLFLILFAALVFVLVPFDTMENEKINIWCSRILMVLSIPLGFFIVQRYYGYGLKAFAELVMGLRGVINLFLYLMMCWVFYLICNRTKYTAILVVLTSAIFGLANYFVQLFRGTPLMVADLFSVGTAKEVASHYVYTLDSDSVYALVITIAFICMMLSLKSYKGLSVKKRICLLIAFLLPYSVFQTKLLHSRFLHDHKIRLVPFSPQTDYASNGSLLSFLISYTYYMVEKPAGYSPEKVAEIAARYESDAADEKSDKKPNIIVVMNETFSDLEVNGKIETSEDYMPFIRNLKEDTIRGNLDVSVFGGNTANTEFEFLTGCSMAFLPFRSVPYISYLKEEMPTMTTTMKEQGYAGNVGFHPGTSTAWSRDKVYEYFGFDQIYFTKDLKDPEYLRGLVTDGCDYDFLLSRYEETRKETDAPFWAFNVTIQNHGGYNPDARGSIETPITITDPNLKDPEAEQYINLVKKSDDAFKELLDYFKNVEEPTIIVMFGDHQPQLPSEFFEKLIGKPSISYSLEEVFRKHTVPYLIWANFDIPEETEDMSANYLGTYVAQLFGENLSGYQKYLCDLREKLPVITANGYLGNDGVLHSLEEQSDYSDLIRDYQYIQYNNIFDKGNRIESFYHLAGVLDE